MTERALLQIQILEKLGVPLIVAAGGGMAAEGPQTAERLAALMGRSVQSALALAKAMEIADSDPQGDSVKLALAALSASLIAGHFRQTGKIPDDNEVKRLAGAMETILSYGDSFLPAASRLQALEPGPYPADEHQIGILSISALAPVVNAVAAFPFGRPERNLAQEVAQRLVARSAAMRKLLIPAGTDEGKNKILELGILRTLSILYVTCHDAGKFKLMAMDDAGRTAAAQQNGGLLPMDWVWKVFELQAGMMETLGASMMPAPAAAGNGDARAPAQKPAAAAPPPPPAAPVAPIQAAPPAPAEAEAAADGTVQNPMAFFKPGAKKPKDGEGDQDRKEG